MGWLAAIAGLAGPITARVLFALGFSAVTFTGASVAFNATKGLIISSLGQAPLAGLQLAGLAGAWTGLGLILGAMNFALTFWLLTKSVQIVGTGGGS